MVIHGQLPLERFIVQDQLQLCVGSSIAINMGGDWWYGTLKTRMNSGEEGGVFDDKGLTRGEKPE